MIKMANTKKFWAKHAQAYDEVMGHYTRHSALVDAHSNALKECPIILESGSGPGHLTYRLLQEGHEVYAVDINPEALKLLKARCGLNPNLHVLQRDANKLPYKNERFDGVSSMLVLWAMEDPIKYLTEHHRVLRPNGRLVLSGPGPETKESVGYQIEMFRRDLDQQGLFPQIQPSWKDFLDYTAQNINHTGENWLTRDEISNLLDKTGFEVVSIKPNPIYCNQGHIVIGRRK